jgi:hypothetical protein
VNQPYVLAERHILCFSVKVAIFLVQVMTQLECSGLRGGQV